MKPDEDLIRWSIDATPKDKRHEVDELIEQYRRHCELSQPKRLANPKTQAASDQRGAYHRQKAHEVENKLKIRAGEQPQRPVESECC